MAPPNAPPPPQLDLPAFQKSVTDALLATTRSVSELAAEDLDFHRSLDPSVASELDKQNNRILELAEKLLRNASAGAGLADAAGGIRLRIEEGESAPDLLEGQWGRIVDVVDGLLERADASLDEYGGVVKKAKTQGQQAAPADAAKVASPAPKSALSKKAMASLLRSHDLPKPQRLFEDRPQDNAVAPWRPVLTNKPHADLDLEESVRLETTVDEDGTQRTHFTHPYASEIASYGFPASMYAASPPVAPSDFASTTAMLVESPEALQAMLGDLRTASEIAIDLEHHDYRTYTGITSLMQISTRINDYIVDTLVPWRRQLQVLNEVFADPSIVKVLHGAAMDIIWLQRDLGLYVVGLFDTYHACRALGYPQAGLGYLLHRFCSFQAQKQYQRADWRIRPLPQQLFDYARSDTHFLLYIFDCMRNELLEKSQPQCDLLQYVLEHSKQEALQRYESRAPDPATGAGRDGWMGLLLSTPVVLKKEQFAVLRAVHAWRDQVAREEDESTAYVLPNHGLFAVARAMPLERAQVFAALPQGVSPVVKARVDGLIAVIEEAKETGKDGPELEQVLNTEYPLGKRKRGKQEPPKRDEPAKRLKSRAEMESERLEQAKNEVLRALVDSHTAGDIRAQTSSFWGPMLNGSAREPVAAPTDDQVLSLALPLPKLTAQVFRNPNDDAPEPVVAMDPAALAEHAFVRAGDRRPAEADDVFTVRQLGSKKRQRAQSTRDAPELPAEPEAALDAADGASDGNADEAAPRKKKKTRAQKKAERREKEQAADGAPSNNPFDNALAAGLDFQPIDDGGGSAPFDYASAPSVLHANDAVPGLGGGGVASGGRKRGGGGGGGGRAKGGGKNKPFDPYKKALDAPRGLGKKQKAGPGRSATFAS